MQEILTRVVPEKIEEKPIKEPIFVPRKSREERKKEQIESIKSFFIQEIGRELTETELSEYIYLFEQGKTNFWHYAKKIQDTNQVPILRQLAQ
jgi:hypothetical protein